MQPPPPTAAEGQIVAGKYQLVRLLGQGGMGAVFEGRNTSTMKRCAVKLLLSPDLAHNQDLVKRFFREARASSVVESEYIVEVFDSGMDQNGCPYMVMELLQGEDLGSVVKRMGALDPLAAAKLLYQATIGLAKAHEMGVVHRDIKPANLFLTSRDAGDLIVKILDFGIAKVKMENFHETSVALTKTGSMLGSPLYMSPEQAQGASSLDARTDVWSLGAVLFELLTGAPPFANKTTLGSLMVAIVTEDVPLVQERGPWVPPELAEIVHRSLSRDIDKRFQSAAELKNALAQLLPDGAMLSPELLSAVRPEQRSTVAPRLILSDDGMLRATGRTGLSVSQSGTTAAGGRRQGRGVLVGGLVAFAAAGAVAVLWKLRAPQADRPAVSTAPSAPIDIPPSAAAAPSEAPKLPKRFPLPVGPAGVQVSVDGVAARVDAGAVDIEGLVGTTRRVRLSAGTRSEETQIAIVDEGLVPDRLELAPVGPPDRKVGRKPAQPVAGKAPEPTRQGAAATTAAPTTTPPQPTKETPKLKVEMDEFGKK